MKYILKPSNKFQKDLKKLQKRGYDLVLIADIIKTIASGEHLEEKHKDHKLMENFANCRECHITPDWLLIYEITESDLILYLTRTGTHSDLF